MEDRQPASGKEGRVKIIPENGTAFYARILMADSPSKVGTPISKATLLSDQTALAYDPRADLARVTPNDILYAAKGMIDTALSRARCVSGTYTGNSAQREGGAYIKTLSFDFAPKLIMIMDTEVSTDPCTALILPACPRGLTLDRGLASGGVMAGYTYGLLPGVECSADGTQVTLASVTYGASVDPRVVMNASGRTYHYVAIG